MAQINMHPNTGENKIVPPASKKTSRRTWWAPNNAKSGFFAGAGALAIFWSMMRGLIDSYQGTLDSALTPLILLFSIGVFCCLVSLFYSREDREDCPDDPRGPDHFDR